MPEPEAHFPYARRLRLDWTQAQDGSWHHADKDDPHRWEVVCAQCGDIDGPADRQPGPRDPFEARTTANIPPAEP